MTTTTKVETRQSALNKSNLSFTADVLAAIRVGDALSVIKVVVVGAAAVAAQDITSLDIITNATITGFTPALDAVAGDRLPAIGNVVSLRVTSGATADEGDRIISDAGGTPAAKAALAAGVATLSDDGKTLTFEAAAEDFVLVYQPRAVDVESVFPTAAP